MKLFQDLSTDLIFDINFEKGDVEKTLFLVFSINKIEVALYENKNGITEAICLLEEFLSTDVQLVTLKFGLD